MTAIDILDAGDDVRMAYALPAVRPGKCSKCGGRTWADDKIRGVCRICVDNPISMSDLRAAEIPSRYRWARLEEPIRPPGWTLERPLIPEHLRRKALAWADGRYDGPRNAITIGSEVIDKGRKGNATGHGKSSFVAAIADYVARKRGLTVAWIHASELRADQEDKRAAQEAKKKLLNAKLAVLDGLGDDLCWANESRGWLPNRVQVVREFATEHYQRCADNILITSLDMLHEDLGAAYGRGAMRRFGRIDPATGREENATIITL